MIQRVLVSACLLGERVRYDGTGKSSADAILVRWIAEGRVVSLCPEVAGGLPVPRRRAEIAGGRGGGSVLAGAATVVDESGEDVTESYLAGARLALSVIRESEIGVAVLKEGSPSCGSGFVYDGTFTGRRVLEYGVTAALLREAGIAVFNELEIAAAARFLESLEGR